MKNSLKLLALTLLAAAVAGALPAWAQTAASGPLVRVTVTATGRDHAAPPPVPQENVIVFQSRVRRPVVDWVPAQGAQAGLDLALIIDENLDTSLGLQLDDLAAFIRSLPASTRVAVIYARNAQATVRQDFSTDHEQAAKSLRLPVGMGGAFSSPYLSLIDLIQRWPAEGSPRRAVLLVSDGISLSRGLSDTAPGSNPDLARAINLAQRRGVQVHTLYATGAGRLRRNFFLISNGQGSLSRLAAETGGEAFFQGFQTPVAFQPFLQELGKLLGQQYLLTFRAQPGKKAGYQAVRVTTEQPGVELAAPERVWVPAGE